MYDKDAMKLRQIAYICLITGGECVTFDARKLKKVVNAMWTICYIIALAKISIPLTAVALIVANGFIREVLK
jgi:hypothetical protein